MSMIEKQIEKWEEIHRRSFLTFANTGNEQLDEAYQVIARLVDEATKMTKYLSAKLSASNLNGGWHVVEDGDLPEDVSSYIVQIYDNEICMAPGSLIRHKANNKSKYFVAWMPLPTPYKKEVD